MLELDNFIEWAEARSPLVPLWGINRERRVSFVSPSMVLSTVIIMKITVSSIQIALQKPKFPFQFDMFVDLDYILKLFK